MRGDEVLYEELLGLAPDGSPRHSTALLGEIERAAAAAGGWHGVGRIAVGLGPGSFVGIRIGIATARGLSLSMGLPIEGVCTLDALGLGLADRSDSDRSHLAVLDARRGEVFAALYAPSGARLWEPLVAAPDGLAERLAELPVPPLAVGSGALRFRDELASRGAEIPDDAEPVHRVAARHVCALTASASGAGSDDLDPIYLRPPDAQRWRERDTSHRAE